MADRPAIAGIHQAIEVIRASIEASHAGYCSAVGQRSGGVIVQPARTFVAQTPGTADDGRLRPPLSGWPIVYVDASGHGAYSMQRPGASPWLVTRIQFAVEVWAHLAEHQKFAAVETYTQHLLTALVSQMLDDPTFGSSALVADRGTISALLSEPWPPSAGGVACRARLMFAADWHDRLERFPLVDAPIEPSTVTVELLED